jgi:hypothetical protein
MAARPNRQIIGAQAKVVEGNLAETVMAALVAAIHVLL